MGVEGGASILQCLSLVAAFFGIPVDPQDVEQRSARENLLEEPDVIRAAKFIGLRAKFSRPKLSNISRLPMPSVMLGRDGRSFILARSGLGGDGAMRLLIQRPGSVPEALSLEDFERIWGGVAILVKPSDRSTLSNQRFGFGWFVKAILRYRRSLSEVVLVTVALQILALATPLFFQVVVDKVLVHRGFATLQVVVVGFSLATCFEVVLGGLRSYIFSHTTNRIDVELSANAFSHLLKLPIAYFSSRRAGDSVARIRELENIRQFITGSAVTLVIDVVFGAIFFVIIFIYSFKMGAIAFAAVPIYLAISLLVTPNLRLRIDEKFRRGAENQSFLVETVTGMETVKALAVEPQFQRRWEEQLAGYVHSAFSVNKIGLLAGQAVQFTSKITSILLLYVGAKLVMSDDLTIGELVAINMFSGQVTGPILRVAQLWQDFQQAKMSIDRVGDILNAPAEPYRTPGSTLRARLRGDISFESVTFRYGLEGPPILDQISLSISSGQVIGIVGPSGSGKSTLTKLVQRLYIPQSGRINIDGADLSTVDPFWLRRQVGVVLQESVLFNGSIRENIAIAEPNLSMDRIIEVSKLAGAHDFIAGLPNGYDSVVGERGSSLSGGQRQRIAIARALALNPRILILDEATSALDVESEQAIHRNMRAIAENRTVLIVAHRLSAVRFAHKIFTVERGQVVESGSHAELLKSKGRYSKLWAIQNEEIDLSTPEVAA